MKLSILISGLVERAGQWLPLYYRLLRQAQGLPVEVLLLADNRKAMPLPDKRNRLLAASTGDFVTFIDDDDDITLDYVSSILAAIEANPDTHVICFEQSSYLDDGLNRFTVRTSLAYENEAVSKDAEGRWVDIKRKPWHWCVWRGDWGREATFVSSTAEDWLWVEAIMKKCTKEVIIPRVLHLYNFEHKGSVAVNGDPDLTSALPRYIIKPNPLL